MHNISMLFVSAAPVCGNIALSAGIDTTVLRCMQRLTDTLLKSLYRSASWHLSQASGFHVHELALVLMYHDMFVRRTYTSSTAHAIADGNT